MQSSVHPHPSLQGLSTRAGSLCKTSSHQTESPRLPNTPPENVVQRKSIRSSTVTEGQEMGFREDLPQEEDEYLHAECGLGGLKSGCLKCCARPLPFVLVYSITGLLTSTLTYYLQSQATTLQRQFGFSSSQMGLLMSASDIGYLSCVVIFSFMALHVHIPRVLGYFTFAFAVAAVMCGLPFFLMQDVGRVGKSNTKKDRGQICLRNETRQLVNCSGEGQAEFDAARLRESRMAFTLIFVGMCVQGICKSPRWTFVSFYVDENVPDKRKSGFYLGIVVATGIIGPAMAYALGGFFTRLFVTLQPTSFTPTHPKWIGAWWLGFVFFGVSSFLSGIPLILFPRWMRGSKPSLNALQDSSSTLPDSCSTFSRTKQLFRTVRGNLLTFPRIVTNPLYVFLVTAGCFQIFSISGMQVFLPKYVEIQFSLPAWKTNIYLATTLLLTTVVGAFTGGYVSQQMKMPLNNLKMVVAMALVAILSSSGGLFLKCEQPHILNWPGY